MTAIFLLALALAMDAFAVAIARGAGGEHRFSHALETGLAFGLAQAIMPLFGWAASALFMHCIEVVDHWIAFGLLTFLGIRMLWESWSDDDEEEDAANGRKSYWMALFFAAIATSIDAAAAGLTLELFAIPVWLSCMIIGVVTAALCTPAYWFAAKIGSRIGHLAEAAGGVVLVGLGAKILLNHLT